MHNKVVYLIVLAFCGIFEIKEHVGSLLEFPLYTQYFFLLLKNKICTQLIFFFKRKLQQLLFKPFFCWRGRFRLNDGFQLKWPKPPKSSALFCLLNFKNSTERLILLMFLEENKNRFSKNGSFSLFTDWH